jgi:hypothetical protein
MHFFVGLTIFIGFLIVHILLVEPPNKKENVLFFVGINFYVLGPLIIYFSIEVKEFPKKRSCFFYFLKNKFILFFIFFFFFFQTNLYLEALFHWEKTISAHD